MLFCYVYRFITMLRAHGLGHLYAPKVLGYVSISRAYVPVIVFSTNIMKSDSHGHAEQFEWGRQETSPQIPGNMMECTRSTRLEESG